MTRTTHRVTAFRRYGLARDGLDPVPLVLSACAGDGSAPPPPPPTAATHTPTPSATPLGDSSEIDLLPAAVSAAIDTLVQERMTADFIPGLSLAVAQNGQTVLAKGYGYAQCGTSSCTNGTPVYADTPFELGSVTKSFTTTGLLRILDNPALNNLRCSARSTSMRRLICTTPTPTSRCQRSGRTSRRASCSP